MKNPSIRVVFSLKQVVFEGARGKIGPLTLDVSAGEDHVLFLEDPGDGMTLVRIIKGMAAPLSGRVLKEGEDTTGWIIRDGIVALVDGPFFSRTVRDEIAFAVRVGESKRKIEMTPFLSEILRKTGCEMAGDKIVTNLSDFEGRLLVLASGLLMLPDCLVIQEPLRGLDDRQTARYLDLLRYGKETVGFATLQLMPEGHKPIPLETSPAPLPPETEETRP